jgi:tetratricopeptide (TPR) repeat protein
MRVIAMRYSIAALCVVAACSALSSCASRAIKTEQLKAYAEAKASYAEGKLGEAEKALLPLAKGRALPQAEFLLGKVRFFLGKYDDAASSFKELSSAFPKYHEADIWIARTYLQQGKIDEAGIIAQELLANDSGDLRLYYLEAMLLSAKGDLQGALGFLERSGESGEELSKTFFESARIYYQFGQDERAMEKLKRAKAVVSPDSPMNEAVDELMKRLGKARG